MFLINIPLAYTITIAGAHGRLGRELVAQSLERGWDVTGVVRRPNDPVLHPVRRGWLNADEQSLVPITSENLTLTTDTRCESDALVICMSAEPFATRSATMVQDEVVRRLCLTCRDDAKICLVSAYGAGETFDGSNVGIQFMYSWYLREAYASKETQEDIVRRRNVSSLILRPRVLSFATIPLNPDSVPRWELAARIINWCCG